MELIDGYTWAWLAFGLFFVVTEWKAIKRKDSGDTLSEHLWKWMDVTDEKGNVRKSYTFRRVALIGALTWLLVHLGWGV